MNLLGAHGVHPPPQRKCRSQCPAVVVVDVRFGSAAVVHIQHIIAVERLEWRAFRTFERQILCLHSEEKGDR